MHDRSIDALSPTDGCGESGGEGTAAAARRRPCGIAAAATGRVAQVEECEALKPVLLTRPWRQAHDFVAGRCNSLRYPPQMAKLMMPQKTWRRWERLGFPESMRREQRFRRERQRASLELSPNEVRRGESIEAAPGRDVVRISGCGCGRHVCPSCGRRLGGRIRASMMRRVAQLQEHHGCEGDIQMWTMTVDPKNHVSPEGAWEHVCRRRLVARTMAAVGVVYYVAVIEWHESGWPHWHVLCWQPVKRMHIPHAEVERRWTQGICRYTARNGRPMAWAINYATKYLCKPDGEAPEWVMKRHHVRSVWGSRGWGPVCTMHRACESDDESEDVVSVVEPEHRSNAEAIASCNSACIAMVEHVTSDGELCRKYLGRIVLPARSMRKLISRLTGCCQRARSAAVDWATWQRLRIALPVVE